ncbi:unnamed protein product [Cuscuta epithymum]|uniref:Uncharacterized protein n=1 Tax=Cuscuta epithymum TaxID=186058 RepID=A0AAV0FW52_9ASTE|nr:unnamed protein product [Cuscuta epithymum]
MFFRSCRRLQDGPVDVGSQGTIGSLLNREIEHLTRPKSEHSSESMTSTKSKTHSSWPGFIFVMLKWKKKKRRASGGGLLLGVCSLVDNVSTDRHMLNEIQRFSYVNLKADSNQI